MSYANHKSKNIKEEVDKIVNGLRPMTILLKTDELEKEIALHKSKSNKKTVHK